MERLVRSIGRKRPIVEAFRNDSRRKLLELHNRKEPWSENDFEEFLRRVSSGRTPAEVGRDPDIPGKPAFQKQIKKIPIIDTGLSAYGMIYLTCLPAREHLSRGYCKAD